MPKYNDRWEEEMIKMVPRATQSIKAKLSMELEIYKGVNSAINDSARQIENPGVGNPNVPMDNPFAQNNGNAMNKGNVRVRTMDAPGGYVNKQPEPSREQNNQYYSGGYSNQGGSSNYSSGNMMGSANTLILISTAVLVALVMFVSLYIMYTMGG